MEDRKLSEFEIETVLRELPNWIVREGKLYREFRFADFSDAFAFMTQAALVAEKRNHHPEWFNVYNRLEIFLSTHELAGISNRDIEWAREVSKLYRVPDKIPKGCCA